jgi:uncharacterized protein (DUF302 family)
MPNKTSALLVTLMLLSGSTQANPQLTPEQQMQLAQLRQVQMMSALFDLRPSRLGFDETIIALRTAAEKHQWKLGPTLDMGAAMAQAGVKDALRMKVIPTCPADADARIARATAGKSPPLPCRITVFVDKNQKVNLIKLNTANLAKSAKGELATIMTEIAAEEESVLKGIAE